MQTIYLAGANVINNFYGIVASLRWNKALWLAVPSLVKQLTKICGHQLASPFILDFLGKVSLNLAFALL